ncbi:MAG TPA: bacillithiol biosynthesis deacetylase BshB1 [Thermoanaerobaculia bacterium]|nr:bacillithiol biosynthesis deacetylase BshB1 [Thermoanaerobaculia bacterium]
MATKGKKSGKAKASGRVDILAFGAHADDVELCCGGTVAEAVRRGRRVGIVDLTRGEMGTRGDPETRHAESLEAARILGAAFRERLDFGDGNLATGREQELAVIRLIRRWRPSILLAPYPDDRHPDHSRTGRLVADAWFYAGLRKIETGQKAHRPDVVACYLQNYHLPPSFVVDVTASHERKMRAIRAYGSQFHDPDSGEPLTFIAKESFLPMIEARSRHFGALIGVEHGEAFVTKQPPRVDDIPSAYEGREVS